MIVDCLSTRGPFARSRSQARYPSLWDGLVLGFAPCLGDFSPAANTIAIDHSAQQHRSNSQAGTNIGTANSPLGQVADLRKTGGGSGTIDFASDSTVGNKFKSIVPVTGSVNSGMTIQSYAMYSGFAGTTALFCTDKGVNAGWKYVLDTSASNAPVVNFYKSSGIRGSFTGAANSLISSLYQNVIFLYISTPWGYETNEFTPIDALFFVDGTQYSPTPSGVLSPDTYDNTVVSAIGGEGTVGRFLGLLNIWDRSLLLPEINILNADPLALYRRRRVIFTKRIPIAHHAAADVTGAATVSAIVATTHPVSSALSCSTTVVATAIVTHKAATSVSVTAVVSASAAATHPTSASVAVTASVSAPSVVSHGAVATLLGSASVLAVPAVLRLASADLFGIATTLTDAVISRGASASLNATATVLAQATRIVLPSIRDVRDGVVYGIDGNTVTLPDPHDVREGVHYGTF